jgi:hypothetical protein
MNHVQKETGSALQCQSRKNANNRGGYLISAPSYNPTGLIWQHRRVQIRFGLPPHHAKLVCELANLGGSANDA